MRLNNWIGIDISQIMLEFTMHFIAYYVFILGTYIIFVSNFNNVYNIQSMENSVNFLKIVGTRFYYLFVY